MKENKIIICEKCFNIPKIVFLNKDEIQLDCKKCKETEIKDFSYFKKFTKNNEDNNLFALPNCDYKEQCKSESILYCFQCSKYICQKCFETHKEVPHRKNHLFVEQKIEHQYYCKKEGHEEYLLDRFCTKCENYLCSKCKCEHEDSEIFKFEHDEDKIKEIKKNVSKCKKIIEDEEKYLKEFIDAIEKKIEELKKLFEDYKKRNLDIIFVYELIIDN